MLRLFALALADGGSLPFSLLPPLAALESQTPQRELRALPPHATEFAAVGKRAESRGVNALIGRGYNPSVTPLNPLGVPAPPCTGEPRPRSVYPQQCGQGSSQSFVAAKRRQMPAPLTSKGSQVGATAPPRREPKIHLGVNALTYRGYNPSVFSACKQAENPAPLASKGSQVAAADFTAAGSAAPRAKKPLPN